ncbi:hypothetical protein QLX08_005891 [Tetragonisca angustula]|uniref:Uncharacterized protein n=1 Tax=Tetragonisca angustula TaxID=166442 RepID=A0AAW0ZWD0_9HYME
MSRATLPGRTTSPSLMDEMRAIREAIVKLAVYTEEKNRRRQKEIDNLGRRTLGLVTEDESPAERPRPPRQQSDNEDNATDEELLSNKFR